MDDTAVSSWPSLPLDLLLEVFRRLESTAVIRCSATCKPWRRAIISNASFLRPRPVPSLLPGVFHEYRDDDDHQHVYLRRTPGPFQSALPPSTGAAGSYSRIQSLLPATTGGFNREMYTDLLSSRDGFILLRGRRWWSGVCLLCNPVTGDSKVIPDATIGSCTYVLLTACHDHDATTRSGNSLGSAGRHGLLQDVRILAVAGTDTMCTKENRITYQVFSFTSGGDGAGAWGPVKHSGELKEAIQVPLGIQVPMDKPWTSVVCGNAVYWFGGPRCDDIWAPHTIVWIVALDVRTGRAWTTELPEGTEFWGYSGTCATDTLLGTSGNGLLSLIRTSGTWQYEKQIEVWVLMDDNQWCLQKTIDVQDQVRKLLLPDCRDDYFEYAGVRLNAFCPGSCCVIGSFAGQEIRIELEGSSHPGVERIGTSEGSYYCNNTYEMDWSTYISMMKQF